VKPIDESMLIFDPSSSSHNGSGGDQSSTEALQRFQGTRNGSGKDLRFVFDRVFDKESTQLDVYEHTTKNLLSDVLNGYNCTVFCYGQTGSGKTHTMQGSDSSGPGVLILTVIDLFQMIERLKKERDVQVTVSYLEVYNEQIRDLLRSRRKGETKPPNLMLLQDAQRGVRVAGLSEFKPRTAQEVLDLLKKGNENRMQAGTAANAASSRSHAVFQILVESRERTDTSAEVRIGKLSLIDLAGSERASETKNRGLRLTEGGNINKSLLALANCINALAKNKRKKYIPYRNSKLTRLLSDSLNGNCRSCMIACVSPSSLCYEDTYNTLKYASRTRNIKTKIVKNVRHVDMHIGKYRKLIKDLQNQIKDQKREIGVLKERGERSQSNGRRREHDEGDSRTMQRVKKELQRIYKEEIHLRRRLLELQDAQRKNQLEIQRKINKIRSWERSHTDTEPGILITTLRSDVERNNEMVREYERQKRDAQQAIQASIMQSKRVCEKLPSLVHSVTLRKEVEHETQKHMLNVTNLDMESMMQHSEAENARAGLLLEESQSTAAHVGNVMRALFEQLQRSGQCPASMEREYRIAKQWLEDMSSRGDDSTAQHPPLLLASERLTSLDIMTQAMSGASLGEVRRSSRSTSGGSAAAPSIRRKKPSSKNGEDDMIDTSASEMEDDGLVHHSLSPRRVKSNSHANPSISSSMNPPLSRSTKWRASREAWGTSRSSRMRSRPYGNPESTDILKQKFADLESQLKKEDSSGTSQKWAQQVSHSHHPVKVVKHRISKKKHSRREHTAGGSSNTSSAVPNYMTATASHRNRFGAGRPNTVASSSNIGSSSNGMAPTVSVSLNNLDFQGAQHNKENAGAQQSRLQRARSHRHL